MVLKVFSNLYDSVIARLEATYSVHMGWEHISSKAGAEDPEIPKEGEYNWLTETSSG